MERTKVVRGLRIAWTVFWGTVFVLLVVLWVRSYFRGDTAVWGITDHRGFLADSSSGVLLVNYFHEFGTNTGTPKVVLSKWWMASGPPGDFISAWEFPTEPFLIKRHSLSGNGYVTVPHWIPILFTGTLAAAAWVPLKFSLRTLLIATTLIAVLLGLVIWFARD